MRLPSLAPAILVPVILLMSGLPARAEMRTCETRINTIPSAITFDDDDAVFSSLREGWFTRGATCPGLVVLREMTPDLSEEERSVFCALPDGTGAGYAGFAPGARDAYGRCRGPGLLCRGVKATAGEVLAISGLGARAEAGPAPATPLGVLADRAGAVVVSGTAGYVASLLQGAGAALAATVGGPAALAGAAVSVVAVGGAVYLCGG